MRYKLLLLLTGLLIGRFGSRMLIILHGFLAKHICSAIFVSGRSLEEIRKHELKVKLFRLPGVRVDYEHQRVSAGLWGRFTRHACYRPGRGCALCRHPPAVSVAEEKSEFSPNPIRLARPLSRGWYQLLKPWIEDPPSPTLALYVLQRGKTVAEWYAPGIYQTTPLAGWSMAKSVMNALVGILVKQGKTDLHASLPEGVWQGKPDKRNAISLHHLLQMSSGLRWTERYWWDSDITRMLFDSEDASHIITAKNYGIKPGTQWQYASGTTNVISKLLRKLLAEDYHTFPYRELFTPLEMDTALIESDACGNFVGSSYMLASAAHWATFGQLYLQDGLWKEERILPEGWVNYSTTPAPSAPQREYGAHFWLNLGVEGKPRSRKMPDVPASVFYASGFGGQRVFMIPSHEMVLVRMGSAHFQEPDFNRLLSTILANI